MPPASGARPSTGRAGNPLRVQPARQGRDIDQARQRGIRMRAYVCAMAPSCRLCGRPSEPATTTVAVMSDAWTAPQAERTDPGLILGERQPLEAWLDFHRDMLRGKSPT